MAPKKAINLPNPGIDTATFAAKNLVKEQSARKRHSQTGSFHGVVPLKLASGKLLWPNVVATMDGAVAANDASALDREIGGGK